MDEAVRYADRIRSRGGEVEIVTFRVSGDDLAGMKKADIVSMTPEQAEAFVDLTAEALRSTDATAPDIQVYGKVRMALPRGGLHWKDVAWLSFGIAINAQEINTAFPEGVTIQVLDLRMPLSDYRAEAAALAMNLWLREEFGLAANDVAAAFNALTGDYTFTWNDTENPFSDPTP